jgi:hypothetical protein
VKIIQIQYSNVECAFGGGEMNFDVEGPFVISRHGQKQIINQKSFDDLKKKIDSYKDGLSDACGCYVFAIRAGKGFTPYYVGQACKTAICKEALNHTNREKYNNALNGSKGNPVLFFVPLLTPNGKFRKRPKGNGGLEALDFLERWLISCAIRKNRNLINNKETRFLRGIHVRGLFNAGKGESTKASQNLGKALF